MKMLIMSFVFLASSIATAKECIRINQIRSFTPLTSSELIIVTPRADYTMTVNFCPELPWAHKIGFDTFSGIQVCSWDRLLILDNFSNNIKASCLIQNISVHKSN